MGICKNRSQLSPLTNPGVRCEFREAVAEIDSDRMRIGMANGAYGPGQYRTDNYSDPDWRALTVYAFDPSLGRTLNNYMTIKIAYERLKPGPVGGKIAVIDYDISNDRYYEAV